MMHGHEKSDPVIVAMKPTNNTERSAAEPVEPRTGTKGNVHQCCPCRAQYRVSGPLVTGVHTAGLPWIPEVGAVCGKAARTDLCGGREVTRVPTATAGSSSRCLVARRRGRWWRGRGDRVSQPSIR